MTPLDVSAGVLGTMDCQLTLEGSGIIQNRFGMFALTFQISLYGIVGHVLGFFQRLSVGNATRQSRHGDGEPAFRFGPQDDSIV